ncbi:MAG TPA: hypothetical protein VGP38_10395 [Rubrobacter sp.]|nr:hypothetical protein [Rubrobacter sp.]
MIEMKSVDAGIGRLIRRPSVEAPDPDEADERYRRSCERYAEQLRTANRSAWAKHHEHLAELHDRLADEHRQRAVSLIGGGGVKG